MLQWLGLALVAAAAAKGRGGARANRYTLVQGACFRFTVEALFTLKDWPQYNPPERALDEMRAASKQFGFKGVESMTWRPSPGGRVRVVVAGHADWKWPTQTFVLGEEMLRLPSPNGASSLTFMFTRLEPCPGIA